MKKRDCKIRGSASSAPFSTPRKFLGHICLVGLACLGCLGEFSGFSEGLLLRAEGAVLFAGPDTGQTTLEEALHAAASGDILSLSEGVHTCASGYIAEKDLTLQGSSEGVTILQTSETPGGVPDISVLTIKEGLWITLNNLHIRHGSNRNGGGIFLHRGSSLTMTNCTVSNNTALYYGGGIFVEDRNALDMTNCTIADNTAWNAVDTSSCGGGIAAFESALHMTDCRVYRNSGAFGGGIYSQPYDTGDLLLQNCTFYANKAEKLGRSLCHHDNYRGVGFVANSIFWGDSQTTQGEIFAPTPLTITCSVTNLQGEGNTSEDPHLGVLNNNGNPTETCVPDEGYPSPPRTP